MPKLGIFWVHEGKVFGRARSLSEGCETCSGRLDSPDDHVTLWDSPTLKKPARELAHADYTEVPRGRVIFSVRDNHAIIYLDESLSNPKIWKRIRDFFELSDTAVRWETDPHYTTDARKLKALLDREFGDGPPTAE